MPSPEQPARYVIVVVSLVIALTSACKQEVKPEVTSFRFSFGLEYSVVKDGAYCAIEQRDLWTDSQVPPPADFDEEPFVMLISNGDCNEILALVSAIDWSRYQNLADSDFEATPPGMQFRERLLVAIGGETQVDWIRDYHKLKEELRKPLEKINETISRIAKERRSNVELPNRLELLLRMNGEPAQLAYLLTFENGACHISSGDSTRDFGVNKFAPLWINILKLRVLGSEYAPLDEAGDSEASSRNDLLSININGKELVDFNFDTPYENQSRVERLKALLDQAAAN